MKAVTHLMINEFKIMKLGIDFMGFKVYIKKSLSFHHLLIPKCECINNSVECNGYTRWNGAILVQETSHNYLHVIQRYDKEIFDRITSEMLDENIKGYLDMENIKHIYDLLDYFQKHHENTKNNNKKPIIKKEYTKRLKLF